MYDLIVVGGGPAGLTATVYAIRKRLNVLMVSKDLGGKTNYRLALPWVEDYQVIRGLEIVNKFRSELEYLKFARHMEPVDRIDQGDHFRIERATIDWCHEIELSRIIFQPRLPAFSQHNDPLLVKNPLPIAMQPLHVGLDARHSRENLAFERGIAHMIRCIERVHHRPLTIT